MFLSKLSAASLLVAAATANPLPNFDGDEVPEGFTKRQEDFHGDGNVEIYISDTLINWGSLIPSEAILSGMVDNCDGGTCSSWEVWSNYATKNTKWESKVIFESQDAQYEEWAKNGLVEIFESTLANAAEQRQIEFNNCSPTNPHFCVGTWWETIDQYWAPATINFRIALGDGQYANTLRFEVQPQHEDDLSETGLCNAAMGMGAAIAGLINPALGPAFALGVFGCETQVDG